VLIDRGKDALCSEIKCLRYTLAVDGEQNIGAMFMLAREAARCPALAQQLTLPMCAGTVRGTCCSGRMWVYLGEIVPTH